MNLIKDRKGCWQDEEVHILRDFDLCYFLRCISDITDELTNDYEACALCALLIYVTTTLVALVFFRIPPWRIIKTQFRMAQLVLEYILQTIGAKESAPFLLYF